MEDLDDEKTIAYIRERLPQDLKEKFSDDEFYYFLDTIYDYYDKSGILDSNSEYVDIDIEEIAKYIAKEAKKNKIGDFDPEAEYQVTLELWAESTFIVIIDKANRLYATRQYDTPINLPELPIQLHMYAWRKTGTANGWNVINPFYEEESESAKSSATTENERVE